MSVIDWIVLCVTLLGVLCYGLYKGRGQKNLNTYFKSNNTLTWLIILLSIMGTQASAITFLSAPGQAYTDGMRFVQYYFGLPIAMVVLCFTLLPLYHKLKVYTAYEFLETRFDLRTRTLASVLFLIQRSLSTGISIYAPSIILSSLFGWNIYFTNLVMGGLLIVYTVSGGAKAVAYTQMQQLFVVFVGMFLAAYMVVALLPKEIGFYDAINVAGKMGKMNAIVTTFDPLQADWWKDKYNIWSGIIGGFFLAFSYFGTDQSQVGRYIVAKDLKESRISLLLNGLVKIPMQFGILLVGVLVFVFYLNYNPPLVFNQALVDNTLESKYGSQLQAQQRAFDSINIQKKALVNQLAGSIKVNNTTKSDSLSALLLAKNEAGSKLVKDAKSTIIKADALADTNDTNYIFLYFVIHNLPNGLVGLLIAVIFLSAWGSIAAALNALSSSTIIDLYKRSWVQNREELHYFKASRWITLFWGLFSIAVAMFATHLGSLIEAVNILGSLFYGSILGIFVVAFYLKRVGGTAVFWATVVSEILVISIYNLEIISFLWLNVIGCLLVIIIAAGLSLIFKSEAKKMPDHLN